MADGFVVVRVVRVRVDDTVYPTATAASDAAHQMFLDNRGHEYAVAHASHPLDGD